MPDYLPYLCGLNVIILIAMCFVVANNGMLQKWQKTRFIIAFLSIGVTAILECSGTYFDQGPAENRAIDITINFFLFGLSPLLPILFARAVNKKKCSCIPLFLYVIYVFILIFLVAFEVFFKVDPITGVYQRGDAFWVHIAAYMAAGAYLLYEAYVTSKNLQVNQSILLYAIFGLFVVVSLVQVIFPDIHIVWTGCTFVSIICYTYCTTVWQQIDGLTGLLSQTAYIKKIVAIKDGEALIIIDIDKFKFVNDTYGHVYGDEVLKEISKVIRKTYNKHGYSFRVGGDEFAIILKKDEPIDSLNEMLVKSISELQETDNRIPSISYGYKIYTEGTHVSELKDEADKNMYENKNKK